MKIKFPARGFIFESKPKMQRSTTNGPTYLRTDTVNDRNSFAV